MVNLRAGQMVRVRGRVIDPETARPAPLTRQLD
jgi:hypothetical protein